MRKVILAGLVAVSTAAFAKVEPSPLFSDGMVLQQNTNARIFGTADPGEKVAVTPSWDGKTYTTTTDRTGQWSLAVPTPAGSFEKYTLTIADGNSQTISNVLVGEVWLASGQSNMQMPLKGFGGCNVKGGYDEIASSGQWADNVRFITIPMDGSETPRESFDARWEVPSPKTSVEFSATAWYFATRLSQILNIPIGIVNASYGGSKVESWLPREILNTYPDVSLNPKDWENMEEYHRPLLRYNAMFYPIRNYTYHGIIWYQGCSNVGFEKTYPERLATMVKHWRSEIGLGDIPFYQVEIAPYDYGSGEENSGAKLRRAQWQACELIPNSGIICTNDIAEPFERFNIHPGNKAVVGHRLADKVANEIYDQKQFLAISPTFKGHTIKGNEVWVAIDSPERGICRNYDIQGFEVAGADGVFHDADNAWLHWQTNEIVVSSEAVPEPKFVRYGWGDFKPGTLYGGNYLPLVPFTTED